MIHLNSYSVRNQVQGYLRYGKQIAKKTEINKKLTNSDFYKQQMIERYISKKNERLPHIGVYLLNVNLGRDTGARESAKGFAGQPVNVRGEEKNLSSRNGAVEDSDMNPSPRGLWKTGASMKMTDSDRGKKELSPTAFRNLFDYGKTVKNKLLRSAAESDSAKKLWTTAPKKEDVAWKKPEVSRSEEKREETPDRGELTVRKQVILNEIPEAKGDPDRLYKLNKELERIEYRLAEASVEV